MHACTDMRTHTHPHIGTALLNSILFVQFLAEEREAICRIPPWRGQHRWHLKHTSKLVHEVKCTLRPSNPSDELSTLHDLSPRPCLMAAHPPHSHTCPRRGETRSRNSSLVSPASPHPSLQAVCLQMETDRPEYLVVCVSLTLTC